MIIIISIIIIMITRSQGSPLGSSFHEHTVGFHNFKAQNFKLSLKS